MHVLAAAGGGGGSGVGSPLWWVILAVIVVLAVIALFRFSGGKGPAVQWFPRFMRPGVNRYFEKRGWPQPYDENLDKIPRGDR